MKTAHRVLDPSMSDPSASGRCALAVMTKAPRAGSVKTRLVPPLTPDEAAKLNVCFLRDTASTIAEAAAEIGRAIAVYTPVGAEEAYIDILPSKFELGPQRGDKFGERLACATHDLFQIGFRSVCLIDSDSPTVAAKVYMEAARLLSDAGDRIVLGPADDGATLRRLCDDLLAQNSNADVAPETRKFLAEIIQREGRNRIWPAL